jgi:hypothetical protein
MATDTAVVRILISDPNPGPGGADPVFSDADIAVVLDLYAEAGDQFSRTHSAAASLARSRAAAQADYSVSRSIGGTYTEDARRVSENWLKVAEALEKEMEQRPEVDTGDSNFADVHFSEQNIRFKQIVREFGDS